MNIAKCPNLTETLDEKTGSTAQFPQFLLELVLKLSKKVLFLQFCVELGKKSKSFKAIYVYGSESYRYTLSENGVVLGGLRY